MTHLGLVSPRGLPPHHTLEVGLQLVHSSTVALSMAVKMGNSSTIASRAFREEG